MAQEFAKTNRDCQPFRSWLNVSEAFSASIFRVDVRNCQSIIQVCFWAISCRCFEGSYLSYRDRFTAVSSYPLPSSPIPFHPSPTRTASFFLSYLALERKAL